MFYIKEIYFRLFYFIFSFSCIFSILYFYKSVLLNFLTFSLLFFCNYKLNYFLDHFIYTHPLELFNSQVFLIIYFSLYFSLFYFFWHILDFLKPMLYLNLYIKYIYICYFVIILFSFCIFYFYLFLFPQFWFFFDTFNLNSVQTQNKNFFLELKINEYFFFLLQFFNLLNILLFFFFFLALLCSFYHFKILVQWKKLFIFLNIVFATLLSPPDAYSQILILCVITIFFEITIFYCLYNYKLLKFIKY
jgi:Sec-independent protein secretion pathway component TatC